MAKVAKPTLQERSIRWLYGTACGRVCLKALVRPGISKAAGAFLSTPLSKPLIRSFVRNNGIDLGEYEGAPYRSFNDFFSRRVRDGARPVDGSPDTLVSPADSLLTVLPITAEGRFAIKNTTYTVAELLDDAALATRYTGGFAFVFRLTVTDYHRYCFPAAGRVLAGARIPGELHTVSPIPGAAIPVYHRNTREYVLLETERFGTIVCMEVGAMLVGRIVNEPVSGPVEKGQEKGHFAFGGSTVVLLVEPGHATVPPEYLAGDEVPIRYGQTVAFIKAADVMVAVD